MYMKIKIGISIRLLSEGLGKSPMTMENPKDIPKTIFY